MVPMTDQMRRPPAVTMACVGSGFIAVMLLIQSMSALSNWGSLEIQEIVTTALSDAGLAARGVDLDTALGVLRIALYVVIVLMIAMVVFAVYAVRGDRPSRVALTILSGLGAFTLVTAGGLATVLPAVLMGAVAFVLWTPEARVWFDLKNGRTPSPELVARAKARQRPRSTDVDAVSGLGQAGGAAPPPPPMPSSRPPISGIAPPAPSSPASWAPTAKPAPRALPGAVIGAAVTMIVGAATTASFTGLIALLYILREVDPVEYERIGGQDLLLPETAFNLASDGRTVTITVLVLAFLTLIAGLAMLVAIALLFNQPRWWRTAIVLTTIGAVGSALALPAGLPITAAAIATFVLLRRPHVRAWAAR